MVGQLPQREGRHQRLRCVARAAGPLTGQRSHTNIRGLDGPSVDHEPSCGRSRASCFTASAAISFGSQVAIVACEWIGVERQLQNPSLLWFNRIVRALFVSPDDLCAVQALMHPNLAIKSNVQYLRPECCWKLTVVAGGSGQSGTLPEAGGQHRACEIAKHRFVDGAHDHRSHLHD